MNAYKISYVENGWVNSCIVIGKDEVDAIADAIDYLEISDVLKCTPISNVTIITSIGEVLTRLPK